MNHRTYLSLAFPLIISTISTPLLGAVDTAVIGQLPDPSYIGGVAIGTIIFNTMYWLFGFLRVSTSGFAAQSLGSNNHFDSMMAIIRPFFIALIVGVIFILFQSPILQYSLVFIGADASVSQIAAEYFYVRIWGAPFTLMNYVILGWLMGMARIKDTLILQLSMNFLNIALALLSVNVFHMGILGVSSSTLISEIAAFFVGIWMINKRRNDSFHISFKQVKEELLDPLPFKKMMIVNRDLFIRTICLLIVYNTFTAKGASFGEEVLAANAILFQIHYIMAYFFDGFANASSILVGKAVGKRSEDSYLMTIKLSILWSIIASFTLAGCFYLTKDFIISIFTPLKRILDLTNDYAIWLILFPICACIGLVFYGVFIGATEAGSIRNSMIYSCILYLLALFLLPPSLGNHGLWIAFILFSLGRSIFLLWDIPRLRRKIFISQQQAVRPPH
ncbi:MULTISPECIES: MATE family efflux transporter [Bacillus]|uniref:Damage-inducible protein F n=2 Tax=Bacillus TaxID=1386 RepID=A0A0M4GCQ1_9BACI|nr:MULTISPECIES: MATE family efflux transporter [Bacillus]ALC83733.1 damage-inducible protein F [Bacillus gobiensis]MBP1083943.1 MATE family multidrug resistance protein [Bacillus capparidis]MED1097008.1 MATE family efflux transporter [Bacillus capparidis]